ncbi:MAG: phosphate ABC transporter permease PstA [Ruminococcus sp.]|nr:phosphate ABC transporter permease PstA [Ruminococcus sp.]
MEQQLKTYKAHPLSLVLKILVWAAAALTVAVFLILVGYILVRGVPYLSTGLFKTTSTVDEVSVLPSIVNTLKMVGIALLVAGPLGIFSAIYLVEYAKKGSKVVKVVGLATQTLSGIPSIIYGIFGSMFFVTTLAWRLSILSGAFTLAIMILPIIITSSEEALKSVSDSFREGSFGLGAGKLRTVFVVVLPSAISGILSGIILAIGRIVGETAALIFTAGTITKFAGLSDSGSTLAVQMYNLSNEGLHMNEASASAVVLLVTVILLNSLASFVGNRIKKSSGEQ